jgi:uncharacterized OB-fold protein
MSIEPSSKEPRAPYDKLLPVIEPGAQPFWEALCRHELIYQCCRACKNSFAPYQPVCPACWSEDVLPQQSTGLGKVYTFSVVHRAPMPSFRPDLPYAVAIVELDEKFFVTTNIVDCPIDALHIGMRVEVQYVDVTDAVTLAKFRPSARTVPPGD